MGYLAKTQLAFCAGAKGKVYSFDIFYKAKIKIYLLMFNLWPFEHIN